MHLEFNPGDRSAPGDIWRQSKAARKALMKQIILHAANLPEHEQDRYRWIAIGIGLMDIEIRDLPKRGQKFTGELPKNRLEKYGLKRSSRKKPNG